MIPFYKTLSRSALLLAVSVPIFVIRSSMITSGLIEPAAAPTFILDFDDTITTRDTISVLAQSAISFHSGKGRDFSRAWDDILRAYRKDHGEFVEAYEPRREERRTVGEEIAVLRAERDVQERSLGRVSGSGMFGGIEDVEFEKFGREAVRSGAVGFREGFEEFVQLMKEKDGKWGVVSVNWSGSFIKGVLRSFGSAVEDVQVLANEPDKEGVLRGPRLGNGDRVTAMTTSDDKLASMKDLVKSVGASGGGGEVVYIGDSGTDIECLMEDGIIGIILSADGSGNLVEIMKRSGVKVLHISEKKTGGGHGIYWTRDFREVVRSSLFR